MNGRISLVLLALILVGACASAYSESGRVINIRDDYKILPADVYIGDTVSVSVNLENKGLVNAANKVKAELVISEHFESVATTDTIETISPGITQTVVFKFRVKPDTAPGIYSLPIRINYDSLNTTMAKPQPDAIEDTKVITLSVHKAQKNVDFRVEPTVLFPGRKVDVKFTLVNTGDSPLSNLNFSWEESNKLILPIGSDNRRYLATLGPGEQKELVFTVAVDPNIAPGVYSFDSTLSYNDESASTNTLASKIGFVVGGTTDMDVSLQETGNGQVSLSIANIGSNNAQGVVVRIPEQPSFSTQGFDTAVLGNLNRGDFTIATFRIVPTGVSAAAGGQQAVAGGAPQGTGGGQTGTGFRRRQGTDVAAASFADLAVEIDYTDTTGERQTIKKTVHFLPQSLYQTTDATGTGSTAGGAGGNGFGGGRNANNNPAVGLVVSALVLGGAGYWYWKKKGPGHGKAKVK